MFSSLFRRVPLQKRSLFSSSPSVRGGNQETSSLSSSSQYFHLLNSENASLLDTKKDPLREKETEMVVLPRFNTRYVVQLMHDDLQAFELFYARFFQFDPDFFREHKMELYSHILLNGRSDIFQFLLEKTKNIKNDPPSFEKKKNSFKWYFILEELVRVSGQKPNDYFPVLELLIQHFEHLELSNLHITNLIKYSIIHHVPKVFAFLCSRVPVKFLNGTDYMGRSLLICSVVFGHDASYASHLLEIGRGILKLNVKDDDGNTALHYAVHRENLELVSLLLNYNANIMIRDVHHNTPLGLAMLKITSFDLIEGCRMAKILKKLAEKENELGLWNKSSTKRPSKYVTMA